MKTARPALAAAIAIALVGDAFAASQMFKCVDGGRTVYQQQPCSPPPEPAASTAQPPASAASNAAPAKKLKRPSPASSAPATPR